VTSSSKITPENLDPSLYLVRGSVRKIAAWCKRIADKEVDTFHHGRYFLLFQFYPPMVSQLFGATKIMDYSANRVIGQKIRKTRGVNITIILF